MPLFSTAAVIVGTPLLLGAAYILWYTGGSCKPTRRTAERPGSYTPTLPVAPTPLPGQVTVNGVHHIAAGTASPTASPSGVAGSGTGTGTGAGAGADGGPGAAVRVMVWNIERGFRLRSVIEELRKAAPDVVLLQEVDVGCSRSGGSDVGLELARALSMTLVYGNEMDGVNIPLSQRVRRTSAGAEPNGSEGNAILSRYPVRDAFAVSLPCVRNKYKPKHDHIKTHCATVCTVDTPIGAVMCASVHLDAFAGRVARAQQFKALASGLAARLPSPSAPLIIGGDLNTHNNSFVRLLPQYAGDDPYRYRRWMESEAEWWDDVVFSGATAAPEVGTVDAAGEALCRGVRDEFDKARDATAMVFGGAVYAAKLDWMLVSRTLRCATRTVSSEGGNGASDHCFLLADVITQ